jgi:hypothetical protein
MIVYYLMFLVPAFIAISQAGKTRRSSSGAWFFVGVLLVFVIGFRESGGDWYNYLMRFEQMAYLSFDESISIKDPAYQLISYYMNHWDMGFISVTVLCAIISVIGLVKFLRSQPNAWLGLAVSIPYLVIVVDMGYMRQGVALALIMWGIVALHKGKFLTFLFFVMFAVSFHKSAMLMVGFAIFSKRRSWLLKLIGVVATGVGLWAAFVSEATEVLWTNYVDAQMQSSGALIRVLLNAFPALLLLMYRKEWKRNFDDYTFWQMIALASLATVGLVGFASTAVDRMALYFLPLQLVVFARLPILAGKRFPMKTTTFLVLLLYFLVLFVWLNFGANTRFWLPYENYFFSGLM